MVHALPLLLFAQSSLPKPKHDSLWAVWSDAAEADSARLNALHRFAWDGYLNSQPDSALYYAVLEYDMAQQKGQKSFMAKALNMQGQVYFLKGAPTEALDYFSRGLKIREEIGDQAAIASSLMNIASVHLIEGDYANAMAKYSRCLEYYEKIGDKRGLANILGNIGSLYNNMNEFPKALEYYSRSLGYMEEIGYLSGIANTLSNIGLILKEQGDTTGAMDHYQRSLVIYQDLGQKRDVAVAHHNIATIYADRGDDNSALVHCNLALQIFEEIGAVGSISGTLRQIGLIYYRQGNAAKAVQLGERAFALANENGEVRFIMDSADLLHNAYRAQGQYAKALAMYELEVHLRDSVLREETQREVIQHEFKYAYDKKEALAKMEQEKKDMVAMEELRRKRTQRNAFIGGFGLMMLLAGVFLVQRNRISKEKKRSEELLLNILPEEVAEELKDTGAAAARLFDNATILFSDFKGFTQVSERLSPEELVDELHICFKEFDRIVTARGIEKIKTIGDAYMCAGGLPVPASSTPAGVVHAALEMQAFMIARRTERDTQGKPAFEMRVGIHSGPVVAGIVGVKKFAYDIWGDTVNIASRMESSGEVGQVNISEATYALVKDEPGLSFTSRGRVQAKGKGEMEMYFVKR